MEKEICEKCNQPKTMYYKQICFKCEKPEIETKQFLNLFKCMYHIEAIGNPGFKNRLWDHVTRYDTVHNDAFLYIWKEIGEPNEDIDLLFDTFNIKDEGMLFFISW